MKCGLFFGSFNPLHTGHLLVAQHVLSFGGLDEIRFVLSPQNPFKKTDTLADENARLEILKLSISDNPGFKASDVEFALPRPSYTIQTIQHLQKTEPNTEFSLILGSDNLPALQDWKDIDTLMRIVPFHVYKRRGTETFKPPGVGKFKFYEAPFLDISATHIRELLDKKKSIKYLVQPAAEKKILETYSR